MESKKLQDCGNLMKQTLLRKIEPYRQGFGFTSKNKKIRLLMQSHFFPSLNQSKITHVTYCFCNIDNTHVHRTPDTLFHENTDAYPLTNYKRILQNTRGK